MIPILQVDEVVSINKRYRSEYADKVKARKVRLAGNHDEEERSNKRGWATWYMGRGGVLGCMHAT